MQSNRAMRDFFVPVVILLLGTAIIAATGFDLFVERQFYQPQGWVGNQAFPCYLLYHYGTFPGFILGGAALILYAASFVVDRARRLRKAALFFVLMLVLGPGLLVNTYFKDHWGRPRPTHLQLFGGAEKMPYHHVWERGPSGKGKSFPSGHAAIAFYLFAPYFVLRRRAPEKARRFLALGISYGIFMGLARMAQGGHFPSDILWAGGMVYLVGLALAYLMKLDDEPASQLSTSR